MTVYMALICGDEGPFDAYVIQYLINYLITCTVSLTRDRMEFKVSPTGKNSEQVFCSAFLCCISFELKLDRAET